MQDVTLLLFLEPYAILLSADILGNICLWGGHVPPSCTPIEPVWASMEPPTLTAGEIDDF
ncbi:hypothetical protein T484DRAFT_1824381 [Baffinella frigidus]|nr:hypothetical protein T484DRAFT_1824381 [Cryptophyta sp. CCMP2293]